MNESRTGALKVPGATLHYEVCGSGRVLLLIPGGPADAGGFAPIRDVLSDRYTVVTYDPRGLSRSPFDGEAQDTTVQTFAQDAHHLARGSPGDNAPMTDLSAEFKALASYRPTHKVRFVTAASLFDGHDAA
ncbi:MAG TPA: alpha/beta hydrolase, partial [Rubrobacter sp.]|nr:alpha/beta hydrolase [Rubrobacter sp.]